MILFGTAIHANEESDLWISQVVSADAKRNYKPVVPLAIPAESRSVLQT
jgi:hypothetical protein